MGCERNVITVKAIILNSGIGTRMKDMTKESPKCFVSLKTGETILERQLKQLRECGIQDIIITTGYCSSQLENYVLEEFPNLTIEFIYNKDFQTTNYIYSLHLIQNEIKDDILLLHGDLVLENKVIEALIKQNNSSVVVSSTAPLPEKDFKAVVCHDTIKRIGIEYFENALACQPVYFMKQDDWNLWKTQINAFCEMGTKTCYAEKALNILLEKKEIRLYPFDIKNLLCQEIDTQLDLETVNSRL